MKYYLFVRQLGMSDLWSEHESGYDYDKLMNKAMEYDDDTEWMIVELKRYHSGIEEMSITKS